MIRTFALGLALVLAAGCSLFTVKQDPMPVMEIRADRPPPGPDRVVLTASSIEIKDKVQFATGKAEILPQSFSLLDDVAKVFVENEQIELVQIEGHTDSTGGAAINRTLSQQRAESVVKYLAGKGVAKKRQAPGRQGLRPRQADRRQQRRGGARAEPPRRVQHPQAGSEEDHREGRVKMTRPSISMMSIRPAIRPAIRLAILLAAGLASAGCKSAGMGPETRADIAAQMKTAEGPIQACYAEVLKKNRRAKGVISLRFVAEANTGQFKSINVLRDEPRDPAITKCVVAEIGKLKLSKPTSSAVQIDQPIRLMPNN